MMTNPLMPAAIDEAVERDDHPLTKLYRRGQNFREHKIKILVPIQETPNDTRQSV